MGVRVTFTRTEMALPALGWKVQAWVLCAPLLTSLHCSHASSLWEEWRASQSHQSVPTASIPPALAQESYCCLQLEVQCDQKRW